MSFLIRIDPGQRLAWLLAIAAVEMAVVVIVAAIVTAAIRPRRAALCHTVWLFALCSSLLGPAANVAFGYIGFKTATIPWIGAATGHTHAWDDPVDRNPGVLLTPGADDPTPGGAPGNPAVRLSDAKPLELSPEADGISDRPAHSTYGLTARLDQCVRCVPADLFPQPNTAAFLGADVIR